MSTNTFLSITSPVQEEGLQTADLETRLTALREQSYRVLRQFAANPVVEQALHVASADLFEGLARLQTDEAMNRRVRRVYATLFRYLVRMSTRPTPFGLFAGIAVGSFGKRTTICPGTSPVESIRTRPDMGWLLTIVQKIEADQAFLPSLNVVANHMVYPASARYILPYADVYGQQDKRSITIRRTPVVQYVLEKASDPVPYKELRRDILLTFPNATEQQIDQLLRQLWENHYLISDLRPPLMGAGPEKYLLEGLGKILEAASFRDRLAAVIKHTEEIDRRGMGNTVAALQALKEQQMKLLPDYKEHYYQMDAYLHLEEKYLHEEIGKAAAAATTTLLRITPAPLGPHHLREYRHAFLERYGSDAEIPLLDLLSPETGLDAPPGYLEPERVSPLPSTLAARPSPPQRERILSTLLVEAMHAQVQEVELTDDVLEQLTQWTPQLRGSLPPTLEMYLQIQAPSVEAIDRGEWRGIMTPTGLSYGGHTFCRFFDMMSPAELKELEAFTRREEALFPERVFAELSFLPTFARGANVAIRPPLHAHEIVVNVAPSVPPERVIALHDLVVGVRDERFYVRSVRLGKEVIVTQSHLLNPTRAPNICRFLLEVSRDGQAAPMLFDWGAIGQAPFLPRVVREKIILSPAQWNVHRFTIKPGSTGSEEARFFVGVQRWRAAWHVPRYVYLTHFDERLLLDLEHPLSVEELRREVNSLDTQRVLALQEMLPDFEHLWLKDKQGKPYVCEFVIPLICNSQAEEEAHNETQRQTQSLKPMAPSYQRRFPIRGKERRKFPGDDWTFLKLYAVPKYHDEIITKAVREVVRRLHEKQLIDRWFFIRYADPEPHLRVRFRAAHPSQQETVLATAVTWSKEVAEYGLISNVVLDSYDREIERYGGPEALDVMEHVFTVNSTALSEIIAATYQEQIALDPVAIAVFTLDQLFEMWGLRFYERLQYLQETANVFDARTAFHSQRKLFCELLFPGDPVSDRELGKQREQLYRLSSLQAAVLSQASSHIHTLATKEKLWNTEQNILSSLAHMHFNRLLGPGREREMRTYAFWKYTLESHQRRSLHQEKRRRENEVEGSHGI